MAETEKSRWQSEWEEIRPHAKWKIIELIFFGGGLAAIYAIVRWAANETVSLLWLIVIFIVSSLGFFFVSLYLRSLRDKEHGKSTAMVVAMMMYLPIILGLAFCVWAYFIGSTLFRLKLEAQSLRSNLDLYVKPRTLTEEQITALASSLSQSDPQDVKVIVPVNDAEAANYMGQILGGLTRGGWKIAGIAYSDQQMNQGISIFVEQPGQSQNPDPKHPTPDVLLRRALDAAKIIVNGSGGSYGKPAYSLTITIGPRQLIVESKPRERPQVPPPPGWQ